jgi:flavin reductase (DIM6/NTAB) family NADH-FMN oxidoreductase RutF
VVTTQHAGRTHGMTANAFISVSLDPPLVLVSVGNSSQMHCMLSATGRYGVSVLAENQEALSIYFAKQSSAGLDVKFVERNGVPLLGGAVAYFVVQVTDAHLAGDHTLFIGRVEHFESRDDKPLLFHSGKYKQVRGEESKP